MEFRALPQWDDFTGRLEAVDTVDLRPRVSGQIVETLFADGAQVRKGQVLFQIDPRPFQAEVDRLTAEVQRAKARAQLAAADDGRAQRLLAQNAIAQGGGRAASRPREARSAQDADLGAADASVRAAGSSTSPSLPEVISPIDGRVSKALITRGNLVTPADLLTTVVSSTGRSTPASTPTSRPI